MNSVGGPLAISTRRWPGRCRVPTHLKEAGTNDGPTAFEQEFLANMVLPDNGTVSDWLIPQIRDAVDHGRLPPMLTAPRPENTIERG